MKTAQPKNVFITGASSGIGFAVAQKLIQAGHQVWGTSRDPNRLADLSSVHPLRLDFSESASVERAWSQAVHEAGHIDVVIQNAGQGIFGSIEEVSMAEARSQWTTLVEGPLQICRLAAAHLRPRGCGMIIGISSLAGELPMPFFAHYSAGKAALSSLLAGLWMELKPFGVQVLDLRPGDIRTPFNEAVPHRLSSSSPYLKWAEKSWKESCELIRTAPEPALVADLILRLIEQKRLPVMLRCGTFFQAKLGALGLRFLSRHALLRSIRNYYGLTDLDAK